MSLWKVCGFYVVISVWEAKSLACGKLVGWFWYLNVKYSFFFVVVIQNGLTFNVKIYNYQQELGVLKLSANHMYMCRRGE